MNLVDQAFAPIEDLMEAQDQARAQRKQQLDEAFLKLDAALARAIELCKSLGE